MRIILCTIAQALVIIFTGLIEVEGKSVPEQKVNKLSNKHLNTEIQELNVLLKGPWIQELKDYLNCIEEKYVPQTNPTDISKDDLVTNDIDNDNAIDAKEFLRESLKLAESKTHSPNGDGFSKLQKRDDGYGAGHCGTFAIFPFLAFLASAVASSLTVMANVNTNINNNNNNNNNNMNMNENMNMNMNSRSLSIREAEGELEDDIHAKSANANNKKPANLVRSQREADEDLNLAGLMGEAAGVIFQNSKSFIPGFKPVFLQRKKKRSPVHVVPPISKLGRHLNLITPPPRPVAPSNPPVRRSQNRRIYHETATPVSSTTVTSTSSPSQSEATSLPSNETVAEFLQDTTKKPTVSNGQDNTNDINEKVDFIDIYDLTTESTDLYIYDSLNDEDLHGNSNDHDKDSPRKPTKKPLILDTKPNLAASNEVHGVDKETNTLVPTLAETLINLKHGLEKDIDNFKIPGLPSVGEIKATLAGGNILIPGTAPTIGITPRKFLTDFLRFPDVFAGLGYHGPTANANEDPSPTLRLNQQADLRSGQQPPSGASGRLQSSPGASSQQQLSPGAGSSHYDSIPELKLLRLALENKNRRKKKDTKKNSEDSQTISDEPKESKEETDLNESHEEIDDQDKHLLDPIALRLTAENIDPDFREALRTLIEKELSKEFGDVHFEDLPEETPKNKFEKEIPENKNEDKENDEHESDKEKKEKPRKKSIDIDANKENKDSTRANVAVTTEGYSLSRIIPGDPINSILGLLSSSTTGQQDQDGGSDTATPTTGGLFNFLSSNNKKGGVGGSGLFNLLYPTQGAPQERPDQPPGRGVGAGLLQFLTPPKVPTLESLRANIKSLLALETSEPEKVESRIIGGKLKNGGFLSTADSNNLDTSDDRDADLKMDTDDFSSSFDNKNETSSVENENLNDDTEGNKSSREDKKIFDDSSRNKIDKKLDLTNKQVDHKNSAVFSLSSLVNSPFQNILNQSLDIPLFRHITEDFSKVSEIIKNRTRMLAQDKNFNSSALKSEWDNLHFTQHVKNASEEVKKFQLPGLPSIGDILDKSRNISSKLENLTSIVSPLTVLRTLTSEMKLSEPSTKISAADRIDTNNIFEENEDFNIDIDGRVLTPDEEAFLTQDIQDEIGDLSLEEYLMQRFMTLVNNSIVNLKYSIDEASKVFGSERSGDVDVESSPFTVKNISYSLLQGIDSIPVPSALQGLVNPEVDVENIEKVLRIIPHLFPYIMQDYKTRFHGLFVGTKLTQEQLFEIHGSLVDWHNKIESVRGELPVGQIHRILGLLQENNLVLMSLVLHLMAEAATQDQGKVDISHHHLRVIDRHLLKAEDLFPGLKDLL